MPDFRPFPSRRPSASAVSRSRSVSEVDALAPHSAELASTTSRIAAPTRTAAATHDELVLRRYQRGDPQALAELVERHQDSVYSYVHYKMNSALAADEITQEVFLGFSKSGHPFDSAPSVEVRLLQTARALCDRHRSTPPPLAPGTLPVSKADILGILIGEELDVLLLKEVTDLTFEQIGSVLSLRPNAVKLLVQSGLRRIQSAFCDYEPYKSSLQAFSKP